MFLDVTELHIYDTKTVNEMPPPPPSKGKGDRPE